MTNTYRTHKGGKTHMDRSVLMTLIIVAGFVIVAGIGYSMFNSANPYEKNTVTGSGQAEVKVVPDLVRVYFNVDTQGATSDEANDKNSKIVDEFITSMVKMGFERKDIQTQGFNIYPEYDYSKPGTNRITGYRATHSIVVEIPTDDSERIGEVIDAGVDAGAGIGYINFELSQESQNKYKADAIKLAAEDAKIKAEALASGLDKEIGELISVSQSDFGYNPWEVYRAEASGAADVASAKEATTSITPGEQTVSASVTAIFKLK